MSLIILFKAEQEVQREPHAKCAWNLLIAALYNVHVLTPSNKCMIVSLLFSNI